MKRTLLTATTHLTAKIRAIKAVEKARREYQSFLSVRNFRDIFSDYGLTKTNLRLENNLVKAKNELDRLNRD